MVLLLNDIFSYYVPKSFGLAPYKKRNDEFSFSYLGSLQTLGILAVLVAYDVCTFLEYFQNPGDYYGTLTSIVCSTIYVLNVIIMQSPAITASNSIASVTYSLRRFINISHMWIVVKAGLEIAMSIILIVLIHYYQYHDNIREVDMKTAKIVNWYSWLVMVVLFSIKSVLVTKFNWMVRMVKQMFDNVNNLLEKDNVYLSDDLTEIASLHDRLTRCAMSINTSYSLSLFFMSCDSFVRLCYTSYILIVCQLYIDLEECTMQTPQSAFTFIFYLMQLWTILDVCQDTSESATNTAVIIHKLLRIVDDNHPNAEKLELFSYQLLKKLKFTACGFFDVDFTFLTTIIGLVTTYVIIFVQFRVVTETNKMVKMPNMTDIHGLLENLGTFGSKSIRPFTN